LEKKETTAHSIIIDYKELDIKTVVMKLLLSLVQKNTVFNERKERCY